MYICIYIYIYSVHNCPQLIPLCNISISLFVVVFESTFLNCANPCRNATFQHFTGVAEKKERNGTNEKILASVRFFIFSVAFFLLCYHWRTVNVMNE